MVHAKLLCVLLASSPVWAAKVVSTTPEGPSNALVTFSHDGQVYHHWVVNDLVCLARSKKNMIVCGRIAQYNKVSTSIRLNRANANFTPGEEVKILYTKINRNIAANTTATTISSSKGLASIGFGAGLSYLFLQGQFHFGIAKKITVGLTVPFAKSNGELSNVSALGVLLSMNYYLFHRFSGYNFEAGVGTYFISKETLIPPSNSNSNPLALYSTLGWKGRINRGLFSLGIGAGFQYIADSSELPDFKGLLPLLALSFGINF